MRNLLSIIVVFSVLMVSCAESKNQAEEKSVIVGYNKKLEVTSCYQDNVISCMMEMDPFYDDCRAKEYAIRTCGDCTHLCSGNPYAN